MARQLVPGFGCEPVRKNNGGITPPRHTLWSYPSPVADFLVKLYDPGAEYTAADDVIKLHPPTVKHDQAVAEDPGCLDPDLFNFDEHSFCDIAGINPEVMAFDEVINYSVSQLQQLYRINTVQGAEGAGWHDEGSPYGQLCSLHGPDNAVTSHFISSELDAAHFSPAEIAQFSMEYLESLPYSVSICHWANHYFAVGYNNDIKSGDKHLYVLDSIAGGADGESFSRAFAVRFRELWNRVQHPRGVRLRTFFNDCEQQEDGKSCAFYAIHNAHRLVHAATVGGNFEQIGARRSPFAAELGQLTPEKVRVWRTKLFKAYHEYQRQKALRTSFADNAAILATPGHHPRHNFVNRFKFTMTPQARADIGFVSSETGIRRPVHGGIPYEPNFLRKEKFNPRSEFARLVQDWRRDDVAGVIIRLSLSDEPSERAMYRAVGWGQTVLLSAYPVKNRICWKRPPKGKTPSAQRTEKEVVQMCKAEFEGLKERSPGLSESQLSLQRDFIVGQMCQATPKLAICPNRDGTTWAKMAWRRTTHDAERVEVTINLRRIEDTMEGAMRLGDYAVIALKGRPEVPRWGDKPLPLKPEAHYIWAGKWPHFGVYENAWASVNLANIHPPAVYQPPHIWDWIPTPGVISANFQRTIPDAVFEELGNPQLHFGNDKAANSDAIKLAKNYRWPPVRGDIPRAKTVNAVTAFFKRIGSCKVIVAAGPATKPGGAGEADEGASGDESNGGKGDNGADVNKTGDIDEKHKGATGDKNLDAERKGASGDAQRGIMAKPRDRSGRHKVTTYAWERTGKAERENVVVPPSAAAKRAKRDPVDGWKHQGIIPRPARLRPGQNRILVPPKLPIHSDAYLILGPPLPLDHAVDDPSRAHIKNKRKAYLASLLQNMSGAWMKGEGGKGPTRTFHPGTGHLHHHHRPSKIIDDHRWRLNYFMQIDPDRFPWPAGAQKTLNLMMNVCEEIRERKQNKNPADAIEWRNFGHLLELGDKVTKLWQTTPLESRQTMRCLNGKCENLRLGCLEFEKHPVKAKQWNLIESYQRWMYGADQCPVDCPLRAFDCPINCDRVHRNPINIFSADFAVLADMDNLPLTDAQKAHVVRVLDETYPSRWIGPPPIHWMPVRADLGFWDHKNQSSTALTARIQACENRLLEWELLSDDERYAIMSITHVYYDDINDIISNAQWARKANDAQRLAREENEIREAHPNDVEPPRVIVKDVYLHMKRKLDRLEEDYPLSKLRPTMHRTYLRTLPKVTAADFENRLNFGYLREFW